MCRCRYLYMCTAVVQEKLHIFISLLPLFKNPVQPYKTKTKKISVLILTRRYSPLRGLTSSSCGGLRPSAEAFFALRAKRELIMLFWPIFGNFWCPVVTLITFSSNISNFERNHKKNKKSKKIQKIHKKPKKSKNCQKWSKNPKI